MVKVVSSDVIRTSDSAGAFAGGGGVTAVSVATANGVSGTSSGGATPALTLALGHITPTSIVTVEGLYLGNGYVEYRTGGNPGTFQGSQFATGQKITYNADNGFEFKNGAGTVTYGSLNSTALNLNVKANMVASTATTAGLNLPHGAAPTTPTNGDLWSTTAGFYGRVNGATVGPFGAGGGGITDGDKGDITVSGTGTTWTIDNGAVTFAKIGNIASQYMVGRIAAGTGVMQELTGTEVTSLLDTFTAVNNGLVPAPMTLNTTDFLRRDGTWAAPAGGGGGASDPLALGATTLYNLTSPTTPTEGVLIYGIKRANRRMIGWKTPVGRTERIMPWLGSNNRYEHSANVNATSFTSTGVLLTAVTAPTAIPITSTNFLTMQKRNQQTISTAAGVLEMWGPHLCGSQPGNAAGGFHAVWRFGIVAFQTNTAKLLCGISNTAAALPNATLPSTHASFVAFAKDPADTAFYMMANGSSGTAQKVALPNTGTLTGITNSFWQVEIFSSNVTASGFGYRITRTNSNGAETVDEGLMTGTLGAAGGLPASTLVFAPHLWMGNTSAIALTMQFSQFFMETD